MRWKGFIAEHDTWKRRKALGNAREALEEFKGRMNAEVRRQEKLDMAKEKDFRRGELPGKFMAKMLYGWNNGKFEEEYLRKLERNLKGGGNVKNERSGLKLFLFLFSFQFMFLYSIFRTRVRVRVTKITLSHSRSHQMTQSQVT